MTPTPIEPLGHKAPPPPRDSRSARGRAAEDAAARLLEQRGYAVLGRNWRGGRGELDLICRRGDLMVFVEVRSARGTAFGTALESVTWRKLHRLRSAARAWLAAHGMPAAACRIDLVALELAPDGAIRRAEFVEGISE